MLPNSPVQCSLQEKARRKHTQNVSPFSTISAKRDEKKTGYMAVCIGVSDQFDFDVDPDPDPRTHLAFIVNSDPRYSYFSSDLVSSY